MGLPELITSVMQICEDHYSELASNSFSKRRGQMVVLLNKVIKDYEIWGGLGDRTAYLVIGVNNNGLIRRDYTEETGQYQKGDGVVNASNEKLSTDKLISLLDGEQFDDEDRLNIRTKCNEIISLYP